MNATTSSNLLKYALLTDATASFFSAILMTAAAGPMANLFNLPEPLLFYGGLAFFPFVAFVAWISTRPEIPRGAAWAVVVLNAIYVVECIVAVEAGFLKANTMGNIFVVGQALVVAGFAVAEWRGLVAQRRTTLARA